MATAWEYTRQVVYVCTLLMRQELLLATLGCKPLGSQWIRDGVLLPRTVPHGGKLVGKVIGDTLIQGLQSQTKVCTWSTLAIRWPGARDVQCLTALHKL
jgi:hypothetical protein